jgi:quinol monooxygenase YgiN
MIVVSGVLKLDPANHDAFAEIGAKIAAASLEEDGCSAYGWWADAKTPGVFRVFEEWADQDAIDTHFATPHMADFMGSLGGVGITEAEIHKYSVEEKSKLM